MQGTDEYTDSRPQEWPSEEQATDWAEHDAHADAEDRGPARAPGRGYALAAAVRDTSYMLAMSGAELTAGTLTVNAAERHELLELLGTLITDARWLQRRIQAIRNPAQDT